MNCTKCNATLSENARFCNKCGTAIQAPAGPAQAEQTTAAQQAPSAPTCSNCNASLKPSAKFCNKCGTAAAQADTAEREPSTQVQDAVKPPPAPDVSPKPAAPTAATPTAHVAGAPPQPTPPGPVIPSGETGAPPVSAAGAKWLNDAIRYLRRIFAFDASVYEELRADPQTTAFSLAAAALGMFAFGLGGFLWTAIEFEAEWEVFWKSALVGTLLGLLFWLAWVLAAVGVLTYAFHQKVRADEVVRVAGGATATLALGFFMFLPPITFGVALVAVALWVATSIFAFQSAFGLEPRQAIGANLAGFAVWAIALPLIVTPDNPLGPGILMFDWSKDVAVDIFNAFSAL